MQNCLWTVVVTVTVTNGRAANTSMERKVRDTRLEPRSRPTVSCIGPTNERNWQTEGRTLVSKSFVVYRKSQNVDVKYTGIIYTFLPC